MFENTFGSVVFAVDCVVTVLVMALVKRDSGQFVPTSAVLAAPCRTELVSVRSSEGFVKPSPWPCARSHQGDEFMRNSSVNARQ